VSRTQHHSTTNLGDSQKLHGINLGLLLSIAGGSEYPSIVTLLFALAKMAGYHPLLWIKRLTVGLELAFGTLVSATLAI